MKAGLWRPVRRTAPQHQSPSCTCPLHKRPDDTQHRLREGEIKEQGERSQEGVQRAAVRATEKKEEEGGSHCLTGSQQTGSTKAKESGHTEGNMHAQSKNNKAARTTRVFDSLAKD